MWELDHKEGRVPKNWCFWTVVLEKTPESPLGSKEIKPVNLKGNQSWILVARTDAEAEAQLIGEVPDAGKDWGQEEKRVSEDEMAGWHHRLDGREFGWTQRVGDGHGGLACCSSWGHKESDTAEQLNWTDREMILDHLNGPTCSHKRPYKIEAEGDMTHK